MQPRQLQELIKHLREVYKCPSCETKYRADDIRFLGEMNEHCFMQLSCHNCSLPVVASLTIDGKPAGLNASRPGHRENAAFWARGEITASEIAEFHRWISGTTTLLAKPKK